MLLFDATAGVFSLAFTDRFVGNSKMSRKIVYEALFMVWRLLFQNGLRRWPKR